VRLLNAENCARFNLCKAAPLGDTANRLEGRLQPVEPAPIIVQDLSGDGGGNFPFFGALLDDVQGVLSHEVRAGSQRQRPG
jgi:hypothetical protein